MNYLAHLYLAGDDDDRAAGALLGDFVKGRLENLPFDPPIVHGIRLHRAIDAYTDAHPLVRQSRERLVERRRVSGIIVDLVYDHFLAVHWARYAPEPLPVFSARSYQRLLPRLASFPPRLQTALPRMAEQDWLSAYAEFDNVVYALERIDRRLRRPGALVGVRGDLTANYRGLEQDFLAFFPQLMVHVAAFDRELAR